MSSIRTAVCGLVLAFSFPIDCNADASVLDYLKQFESETNEGSKVAIVEQLDRILRLQTAEQLEAGNEVAEKISSQDREKVAAALLSELERAQSLELVSQLMLTWWRYEDRSKDLAPETAKMMFRMLSDVRHNGKRLSPTTPHERAIVVLSSCTDSVLEHVVTLLKSPEMLEQDAAVQILSARGYFEDHFDLLAKMADSREKRVCTSVAKALVELESHHDEAVNLALGMLKRNISSDAVARTLGTLATRSTEAQAARIQLALVQKIGKADYVTSIHQRAIYFTMQRLSDRVQRAMVRRLLPHLSPQNRWLERAVAIAGANASEALPYFQSTFEKADEAGKLNRAEDLWRVERDADRVLPVFLKALNSDKTSTRYYGFKGLRTLGKEAAGAEDRLVELLDHEKAIVVRQSLQTIAVIGTEADSTLAKIAQLASSHADLRVQKTAAETAQLVAGLQAP